MEYVFGTENEVEVLKTKGSAHTDLTGFQQVERRYPDQTITDSFRVVRKLGSRVDPAGNCYDWYEIDRHYRYADTRGVLAEVQLVKAEADTTTRLSGQITTAARLLVKESTEITDEDAVKMPDLFKTWAEALEAGAQLEAETILNKDGTLYRVVQAVTPMEHQPPDSEGMLAIYRPIDTSHAGTLEDPIPWAYGMDCETGLHYLYGGKLWLCGGDMKPCVWAPGTEDVWQWTEVEA